MHPDMHGQDAQTQSAHALTERAGTETFLIQSFESLGLSRPILEAIAEDGYDLPTPIQSTAIPPAMQGRDVLGLAQTGTGKTAAFALPLLDRLMNAKPNTKRRGMVLPRALILSPTRELATQIAQSASGYARHTGLSGCTVYGGVRQYQQVRKLKAGVDVIVATPGRLQDLMDQGYVDLSAIEVLVLDEADRMLDMGFIKPIREIAAECPKDRQTLMFSATLAKEIEQLAQSLLKDPVRVEIAGKKKEKLKIKQEVHMVEGDQKQPLLEMMLGDDTVTRAVVFTRTKHGADKVAKKLGKAGVTAVAIHGNKNQNQRDRALDAFRHGRSRVLVATDVAARGLDVDGVSHVFNFNLPNEPEAYVHRIGRTGRNGAEGIAVSFCDPTERAYLRAIEKLTGKRLGGEGRDDRGGDAGEHRKPRKKPRRRKPSNKPVVSSTGEKPGGGAGKPRGKKKAGHRGQRKANAKAREN
ncbi:MAG: DEAD/DEAH box helicase [Planctomycetota bacterium]